MKGKFSILLTLLLLASTLHLFGQNKHTIHYQGIARNAQGHPLASTTIAIRLSIKDALDGGTTLYSETKSVATNAFGMYSISINDGTGSHTGSFDNISWVPGSRFLMTEIDPANGTSFVNMGRASLQSVPYAISAKNLEGVTNPQNGDLLEYNNGSWNSKPSPRRYSTSGLGNNPAGFMTFIGPTISCTIEKDNPLVLVQFYKTLGSTAQGGANSLTVNLGYKKLGGSIIEFDTSKRLPLLRVAEGTRFPLTLFDVIQTDFEQGQTYEIGTVGFTTNNGWNSNDLGAGFIEISY